MINELFYLVAIEIRTQAKSVSRYKFLANIIACTKPNSSYFTFEDIANFRYVNKIVARFLPTNGISKVLRSFNQGLCNAISV